MSLPCHENDHAPFLGERMPKEEEICGFKESTYEVTNGKLWDPASQYMYVFRLMTIPAFRMEFCLVCPLGVVDLSTRKTARSRRYFEPCKQHDVT